MAKLSARGRKEVVRFEKIIRAEGTTTRITRALMTDGYILEKVQYKNEHTSGRWSPGAWKIRSKMRKDQVPRTLIKDQEKYGYALKTLQADLVEAV